MLSPAFKEHIDDLAIRGAAYYDLRWDNDK